MGKALSACSSPHYRSSQGWPGIIISEEMGKMAIGKRTLQFVSDVHGEHWRDQIDVVEDELATYRKRHADCLLVHACGTTDAAIEHIEAAIDQHGARFAVVDYVGLLRNAGKTRHEQVSATSIALRELATRHGGIVIVVLGNRTGRS